jgi:hypothetical protein
MGKSSYILGIGLIALSGILYTVERIISVLKWTAEYVPVKINGSGTYSANPDMPGIFDNIFVAILLILGVVLLIIGVINGVMNRLK